MTARILCFPDLLTINLVGPQCWSRLRKHIDECEWWELYNMLEGIYAELEYMTSGLRLSFVDELNEVFGEESVGWRINATGHLDRQLPKIASAQEEAVFKELQTPRFSSGLAHLICSRQAYNARPRRDREVCSEAFDALESVAKEVLSLPTGTFGDAIKTARSRSLLSSETLSILEKIYALRSNHFGHGMTTPFALKGPEVEFVYLSCIGGMLMFVRLA